MKFVPAITTVLGCMAICTSIASNANATKKKRGKKVASIKCTSEKKKKSINMLFIGNSFTYGPPPYEGIRPDQQQLNNLPRLVKLIAESLDPELTVNLGEDTIGGCTLSQHRPSVTPEQLNNETAVANGFQVAGPPHEPRLDVADMCTVRADVALSLPQYHPCPQLLTRQPFGPWDYVAVQDFSSLPTVQQARETMMLPAIDEIQAVLRRQGQQTGVMPIVASYLTWSYYNGTLDQCPHSFRHPKPGCFPLGSLETLSDDCSVDYHDKVREVPCQAYALARAYADTLNHGVDVLVPAGLAWQAAIGSPSIPQECKNAIDNEYPTDDQNVNVLDQLDLPLPLTNPSDARWTDMQARLALYRDKGPAYKSPYCTNGCTIDHHPSILGMYLNALVFYATLFKRSPFFAGYPNGILEVDGMVLPFLSAETAHVLQRIAHDIVMPYLEVWWNEKKEEKQ